MSVYHVCTTFQSMSHTDLCAYQQKSTDKQLLLTEIFPIINLTSKTSITEKMACFSEGRNDLLPNSCFQHSFRVLQGGWIHRFTIFSFAVKIK